MYELNFVNLSNLNVMYVKMKVTMKFLKLYIRMYNGESVMCNV